MGFISVINTAKMAVFFLLSLIAFMLDLALCFFLQFLI